MKILAENTIGVHAQTSSGEVIFVKLPENPVPDIEVKTEKKFYELSPEFRGCVYVNIDNPETEYARLVNNHYIIKKPGEPIRYEEKLSDDKETKIKQMLKRIGKEA